MALRTLTKVFRHSRMSGTEGTAAVDSKTSSTIDRYLVHVIAYCFALHFFLGLVEVLNASNLSYFYYFPATVHIVIAGPSADMYLWTCSLIVSSTILLVKDKEEPPPFTFRLAVLGTIVLAVLLLLAPMFKLPSVPLTFVLFAAGTLEFSLLIPGRKLSLVNWSPRGTAARVGIYLLAFFCTIEISSSVFYVLRAFGVAGIAASGQLDAVIELQLTYAAYGALPLLYIGFLTSCFWAPVVNHLWKRNSVLFRLKTEAELSQTRPLSSIILDPKFLLAIVVAVFIGYYPYFQSQSWLVGTDSYSRYYEPLLQMNAGGPIGAMRLVLKEDHPLTLMFLYSAQLTGMGPFNVVRLSPVFLTLTLALMFLFFIGGKNSNSLGLMAFLFSVLSATTAIGLYASAIANWMVLVVWVAFLAYLGFRTDEHYRERDFFVLLFLSTLMVVIHPWTWGVFAIAILAASVLALNREKQNRSVVSTSLMRVILIDYAFVFFSVIYLTWSEGWGVFNALTLYTYVFRNPPTVLEFWAALNWTTKFWSQFFSPFYILLATFGVVALLRTDVSLWRQRLILSWIFASLIGSILVAPIGFVPNSPASSDSQLWRMMFLTPFQVTVPFGVLWISGKLYGHKPSVQTAELPKAYAWGPAAWVITVLSSGIIMAFAPYLAALAILLISVPITTAVLTEKISGSEGALLSCAIQAVCILIAFNYTARAISGLLIDPHNYPYGNAQFGTIHSESHTKQGILPPH